MPTIPGLTPNSPVRGEELNSDNFTITAGQFSVKIDPSSTGLSSSALGLKVTSTELLWRKNNGAIGLTFVNADYASNISHFGNIAIGQTADAISPLTFGPSVRNDVIRMYYTGSSDHQFYGFGINGATLRYQVDSLASSHRFYGAASSTTSRQYAKVSDRDAIFGEPLAAAEGHWQIGTQGQGDNGYIRFRSPDAAAGVNKIQAEIYCDGFSGNGDVTGSTMEFRTAATSGPNTPLINRMLINGNGDLLISDKAVPYTASTGSSALVTINGSLRMRGGAMSVTGRQTGGIVFGAGPGGGAIDNSGALGDSDGGISSSADGAIDIYTDGQVSARFRPGGNVSKPGGGTWGATSDVRTKRDIQPHKPNPEATLALNPIEYYYNGTGGTVDDGRRHVGFSAQELEATDFAHWVTPTFQSIDGEPVRQVDLSNLTYELLGVVQMQAQQIAALEQRLNNLVPVQPRTTAKRKV